MPQVSSRATEPPAQRFDKKLNLFQTFRAVLEGRLRPESGLSPLGTAPFESTTLAGEHLPGSAAVEHDRNSGAAWPELMLQASEPEPEPASAHPDPLLLDPLTLALAAPGGVNPGSEAAPRADFAAAVEELVRRISWGGDRRAGTARIEIGGGAMKGGAIIVHASGRQVSVELELPAGVDTTALEARLRERFAARGIEMVSLRSR